MTKTLLIDMDGVLFDLATPWYEAYNKLHPDNPLTHENVTEWDIPNAKYQNDLFACLKGDIYRHLKPLPGAVQTLKDICQLTGPDGTKFYHPVIVTAATIAPHSFTDKVLSMQEHFPFIPFKDMICAYHKGLIRGDLIIDDAPKNINSWKAANPEGYAISIEHPYNVGRLENADYVGRNWNDIGYALRNYFYQNSR